MTQNASKKKTHHRHQNSNAESQVPISVAQLECPLSPAITESGALPLSKRRCVITGT